MPYLKSDLATKLVERRFVKSRNDYLLLLKLKDGSFLVVFEETIESGDVELLIGCIGQWVNTDDFEWAQTVFGALLSECMHGINQEITSVSDCLNWRQRLVKWLTQPTISRA